MPTLSQIVFADEQLASFAALDAAACPDLIARLRDEESDVEFDCLYRGELEPDVAFVAPYLARLQEGTPFTKSVLSGFGQYWGIIALVPKELDLPTLRRHLRKFNMVVGPDRKEMYFRYYDARVLRVMARVLSPEQLRGFFGPVRYFLLESTSPGNLLRLSIGNSGALETEDIVVSM